jgi:membrane protease YdiL (CAAX protease family)
VLTWTVWDAALVITLAFVVYVIGQTVLVVVDAYSRGFGMAQLGNTRPSFWVFPASYCCFTLATIVFTRWWIVGHRRASWTDIGFRPAAGRRSISESIPRFALIAVVCFVAIIVATVAIAALFRELTKFQIKGNTKELVTGQLTFAHLCVLVVLVAILAPLTEETLFRGLLMQGLDRSLSFAGRNVSIAVAVTVSGTIFGLFHLLGGSEELHTLPTLIAVGIILGIAFRAANSQFASMATHGTLNLVSILAVYADPNGSTGLLLLRALHGL